MPCTLAIVEVDPETGRVAIDRYVVAHDCGVVVNPMLVEGQIVGGTAQGLGGALFEELVYDRKGQLLTGSLMDYCVPTASDIPDVQIAHQHSPSPLNPLGVKGVGEGGAVAPPAAIANAVCDALARVRRRVQRHARSSRSTSSGHSCLVQPLPGDIVFLSPARARG